jgi:hypothetical protein
MNEMDVNCRTERIYKKFLEISIGGKRSEDDLVVYGRIMLKWILNTESRPKDVGWIFGAVTVVAFCENDTDIPGFTKVTKLLIYLTTISYLAHIFSMELAYLSKCKRQVINAYTYSEVSVI